MTVDRAIVILEDVLKSGWCLQPGAINEAIEELEELTSDDIVAILSLSSKMNLMAMRISELEEWKSRIENNICEDCWRTCHRISMAFLNS